MRIRLLCVAAVLLATLQLVAAAHAATPNSVQINADGTMTVDGAPFRIKGVGQ
jgi:ABC-type nitrate/sulfonate/bicarbonate transport system substrate-binding protein